MAIRVLEYHDLPEGDKPIRPGATVADQSGTVGGASVQSSAFAGDTNFVTVQSDEACHVVFGANPTATTGGYKIAAGGEADFWTDAGQKVAWIAA